jgi:hypothetical protein
MLKRRDSVVVPDFFDEKEGLKAVDGSAESERCGQFGQRQRDNADKTRTISPKPALGSCRGCCCP